MYTSEDLKGLLNPSFQIDPYAWTYKVTEHACPACEKPLTIVVDSTMLVCVNKEHGPYFLV